jgi:hypothetical protein
MFSLFYVYIEVSTTHTRKKKGHAHVLHQQLQQSYDDLSSGTIGKHTMSRKAFAALRRRLNYHGFKKETFMITKKLGTVIEKQQRRDYMRYYRSKE